MNYRVDHHFNLQDEPVQIVVQERSNSVWLYSTTYKIDFTIELYPHHLDQLRQLVAKLEEADGRMQRAEQESASRDAEQCYLDDTPITITSDPAW